MFLSMYNSYRTQMIALNNTSLPLTPSSLFRITPRFSC